jgi:hypothetical protein
MSGKDSVSAVKVVAHTIEREKGEGEVTDGDRRQR